MNNSAFEHVIILGKLPLENVLHIRRICGENVIDKFENPLYLEWFGDYSGNCIAPHHLVTALANHVH